MLANDVDVGIVEVNLNCRKSLIDGEQYASTAPTHCPVAAQFCDCTTENFETEVHLRPTTELAERRVRRTIESRLCILESEQQSQPL